MSLVDLGKRLLESAKRGDTESVRALMSNGAPFTTDWLGTSPLHFAAQFGHHQTAEVLLRSGISRDARTKVDRTPLHVAAQEGHIDIVELLLNNSADIEAKDMLKMTPLHWATERAHVGIIDLLVRHGADLNCDDKFERTSLDIAMANGRTDIAQMLQLAHHTDIGGVTEGDTITIETSEPIITETVTTSAVKTEMSSDSEQSSTSVLATLAALAEATAPINVANVTSGAAVHWLESQGITMIAHGTDGGLITSAVESGQTITLTEAGKIALNYMRQDPMGEEVVGVETTMETVVGEDGQNVITIVANQNGEALSEEGQVLVTVGEDGTEIPLETEIVEEGEVMTEVEPDIQQAMEGSGTLVIEEGDGTTITVTTQDDNEDADEDSEKTVLRQQLEALQRQSEEYKEQLRVKNEEAAKLSQRLSEIETVSSTTGEMELVTEEEGQEIHEQLTSLEEVEETVAETDS